MMIPQDRSKHEMLIHENNILKANITAYTTPMGGYVEH